MGFYDPIKGDTHLDVDSILLLLKQGAQPSDTVSHILKKANLL